jgi:adenylate cyclase
MTYGRSAPPAEAERRHVRMTSFYPRQGRALRNDRVMPQEIERKFLVDALPGSDMLGPGVRVRQGYLAVDGAVEVRIRLDDKGARLTVKAGSGLTRTEVEVRLEDRAAHDLWPHTDGRRVEKVRHRRTLEGGEVAEVDLYEGGLAGLCTVEVEFPDEAAAAAFRPPKWFGSELTGQSGWSNAALADHGRPS